MKHVLWKFTFYEKLDFCPSAGNRRLSFVIYGAYEFIYFPFIARHHLQLCRRAIHENCFTNKAMERCGSIENKFNRTVNHFHAKHNKGNPYII